MQRDESRERRGRKGSTISSVLFLSYELKIKGQTWKTIRENPSGGKQEVAAESTAVNKDGRRGKPGNHLFAL